MKRYEPVSCQLHSELELLAMHADRIRLSYRDPERLQQLQTCIVHDLLTRNGEEFLICRLDDGQTLTVRLDRVVSWEQEDGGVG